MKEEEKLKRQIKVGEEEEGEESRGRGGVSSSRQNSWKFLLSPCVLRFPPSPECTTLIDDALCFCSRPDLRDLRERRVGRPHGQREAVAMEPAGDRRLPRPPLHQLHLVLERRTHVQRPAAQIQVRRVETR